MADTTQTQAALALQTYLNTSASPLGPALQCVPLINIGIDEGELTALPLASETRDGSWCIRARHAQGLTLMTDIKPDNSHHALIWQMRMAQAEGMSGPRLHHFYPLQIALDGTLAPDPVIHTWRGGAMQTFSPPMRSRRSAMCFIHVRQPIIRMGIFLLGRVVDALVTSICRTCSLQQLMIVVAYGALSAGVDIGTLTL